MKEALLNYQPAGDDLLADMWATADETREDILDLYRRVWAHADTTIAELDLGKMKGDFTRLVETGSLGGTYTSPQGGTTKRSDAGWTSSKRMVDSSWMPARPRRSSSLGSHPG